MITSKHIIRFLLPVTLLLCFTAQATAVPVLNKGRPGLETPRFNASPSTRIMDIDRAIDIAERRYNGRAVGARHLGNGVYRVRILQNNGKVKTVTISDPGARR